MEKILAKLPELHRKMVQNTLDAIGNETGETRRAFCCWLSGQADMLLASQLINMDEYLTMIRVK